MIKITIDGEEISFLKKIHSKKCDYKYLTINPDIMKISKRKIKKGV